MKLHKFIYSILRKFLILTILSIDFYYKQIIINWMRKKARNPDEYVFYEGIDNINFPEVNFEDEANEVNHKFSKYDGLNYFIDNNDLEETEERNKEKMMESLQDIFDNSRPLTDKEAFRDFLNEDNIVISSEEEFRQKNFKDFLELKYETKLPKSISGSSLIPAEILSSTSEKIEIHDDPSKLTGLNKHRTTVLIKKDNNDVINGIQVICICGERINISFDYLSNDTNTQSEYEEQSPQE